MKVSHSCPHCGCGKKSAPHVMKHKCRMCGGSWLSTLGSIAKKVVSNPMVQSLGKKALSQVMSHPMAQKVQGMVSNPMVQRALAHPMAQHALGAVRRKVGLGRRRKGAMLPVGHASSGEAAYGEMRASGRRRKGGKGGMPGGLGMATQALGMIPGAAEALGPFGALLGMEAPPPPPPHATFSAVRAGPTMAARPRTVGRGGLGFSDVMSFAKKVVSNPMVQSLGKKALSQVMSHPMAQKVQGMVSNPMVQRALAHPMAQHALGAVRRKVGLGRRSRPPTKHSLAVGRVMKETGMSLAQASKYVKENGLAM